MENEDLEELTNEIRRLIESNKSFLERVNDEEYENDGEGEGEESDPDAEEDDEEYEEL